MENKNSAKSKKIVAIALLAAGIICIALGVIGLIGGSGSDPYEQRNGIVLVYATVYDAAGNSESGFGTGWAIGKPGQPVEYIVTNGHVVEKAYTYPRADATKFGGDISVYFSVAENDFVKPEVVYFSPQAEKDICILKLPTPTTKRTALTLRSSDSVKIGETAYALGYPGNSAQRQDYKTFDPNDITMTRGIISKRTTTTWATYEAFQMDVSIAGGNSGGPLVDEKGNVIGINTAGAVDPQTGVSLDMNYAIITDELVKVLNSEGIDGYVLTDGSGSAWMAYVFLPLGVILLAAGLILLLTKKQGGGAEAPAEGKAKAGAAGRSVLRGVTGRYAAQSFDLAQGKVVLGRDPTVCNIVYDKDAPGISGRHCQVAYNAAEDCFMLTDLGSSYGTFLGNGKKLATDVTEKLSAGDTFYLCDTSNRFVVTKE